MHRSTTIFLLLLLFYYSDASAQLVRPDPVVDMTTTGIRELPIKPEAPSESICLNDDWHHGDVVLKNNTIIKDVPLKYDLKNNVLELNTTTGVKVVILDQLKSFEIRNHEERTMFLNIPPTQIQNVSGLVQQLVQGNMSLYSKPYLRRIPANYNPALDIGSRSDKFVKEQTLWLVEDNIGYDITKSGKGMLRYFHDKENLIKDFVKQNTLSYKSEIDLVRIVNEYNEQ